MQPDAVIVQDPTLLHSVEVFDGLAPDGYILLNTSKGLDELGINELLQTYPAGHVRAVPATDLALTHVGRPIPNAALLGSFAAMTGVIDLDAVKAAIKQKFPGAVGDKNVSAATAAFDALQA